MKHTPPPRPIACDGETLRCGCGSTALFVISPGSREAQHDNVVSISGGRVVQPAKPARAWCYPCALRDILLQPECE